MRRSILVLAAIVLSLTTLRAQTMADDLGIWADGWKYAFSREGRQNWKPEFTARLYAGLFTEGPAITGGVRIDDKRTVGLMAWKGRTYIDAAPADVYSLSAGLYMRRYFHLGKKDIAALYSDFAIGAGYVYDMDGGYMVNTETGETVKTTHYSKGDVLFSATWQPGIRFRIWKNFHLFFGPTISTDTVGFHLGAGF